MKTAEKLALPNDLILLIRAFSNSRSVTPAHSPKKYGDERQDCTGTWDLSRRRARMHKGLTRTALRANEDEGAFRRQGLGERITPLVKRPQLAGLLDALLGAPADEGPASGLGLGCRLA